jgi:hypothetical protein
VANVWESRQPLNLARYALAACAFDGSIYIFGGATSGSAYYDRAQQYTPGAVFYLMRKD